MSQSTLPGGVSRAIRAIAAVAAGCVTWMVVATIGNFGLRAALPGYTAVEASMAFTIAMMFGRLALGIVSSFAAGYACSAIARRQLTPVYILASLLLLAFVPMHISLWPRFPVWYHLVFLLTLAPLVLLGAMVQRRQGAAA